MISTNPEGSFYERMHSLLQDLFFKAMMYEKIEKAIDLGIVKIKINPETQRNQTYGIGFRNGLPIFTRNDPEDE